MLYKQAKLSTFLTGILIRILEKFCGHLKFIVAWLKLGSEPHLMIC